jgi:hypothetical protein
LAVQKRTSLATGICVRTITNVLKRNQEPDVTVSDDDEEDVQNRQPTKREIKPRTRRYLTDIHENTKFEISNTLYDMVARKEFVTLDSLLQEVKRKQIIDSGRSSLYGILKQLGFKYKKYSDRTVLCEKSYVVQRTTHFLRQFLKIREEDLFKNIIVLDETWIYQSGSQNQREWTNGCIKSVRDSGRTSNGKRYIILHAGTKHGFIDGAGRIFTSTSNSKDYHDSMNHAYFEEWFNKLLESLNEPSVIILDNASYH